MNKYIKHPYNKKRKCERCEIEFDAKMWNAKFCKSCLKKIYSYPLKHLSTMTVGAIGELVVATDLMKKGYEVFRALSPSCSCDLAILKNNKLLRIEVRTGNKNPNNINVAHMHNFRADVLAIIYHEDNNIIYKPNLP